MKTRTSALTLVLMGVGLLLLFLMVEPLAKVLEPSTRIRTPTPSMISIPILTVTPLPILTPTKILIGKDIVTLIQVGTVTPTRK